MGCLFRRGHDRRGKKQEGQVRLCQLPDWQSQHVRCGVGQMFHQRNQLKRVRFFQFQAFGNYNADLLICQTG